MSDLFRCDVCGSEFDYPHTPLDHPLRVHRMVRESRLTDVQGRLDLLVHVCQDIVRDAGTAKWPVNLDRLRMALDEMGALEEPTDD